MPNQYRDPGKTPGKKRKISAPAVMPVMGLGIPRLTPPAVRRTLPRIIGARQIRVMIRHTTLLRCIRRSSNRTPGRNRKTDNRHNTHDRRELSKLHTDLFRLKKYQGIRRSPSLTLLSASAAYLQPSTPHRPQDPQHQSSGTDPDSRIADERHRPVLAALLPICHPAQRGAHAAPLPGGRLPLRPLGAPWTSAGCLSTKR